MCGQLGWRMSDNISANVGSRHHKENPLGVPADIQNVADYAPNAICEENGMNGCSVPRRLFSFALAIAEKLVATRDRTTSLIGEHLLEALKLKDGLANRLRSSSSNPSLLCLEAQWPNQSQCVKFRRRSVRVSMVSTRYAISI
jgi:hypothetical protein